MSWAMLALIAVWPNNPVPTPAWHMDYSEGMKAAAKMDRSVAVFIGRGSADALVREGALSVEARRLLVSHFVCIFIDQDTEEGKKVADQFAANGQPLLVISDKTRQVQAVRKTGPLSGNEVASLLGAYKAHEMTTTPAPTCNGPSCNGSTCTTCTSCRGGSCGTTSCGGRSCRRCR